jgi:hypothetical protein
VNLNTTSLAALTLPALLHGHPAYALSPLTTLPLKEDSFPHSDPVLLPFLRSADEAEAQDQLSWLATSLVSPVVRKVVGFKLGIYFNSPGDASRHQDAEDLYNEVLLRVIARLRQLKAHGGDEILKFESYVAVVAHHACRKYFDSQKHPQRKHIEGRLRRLLSLDDDLDAWQAESGERLCGLESWRPRGLTYTEEYRQLLGDPREFLRMGGCSWFDLKAELLAQIFQRVGVPLRFRDLARVVAELCGIPYRTTHVEIEERAFTEQGIKLRSEIDLAAMIEERDYLRCLWNEIGALPLSQRTVLLLNLKDTHGANLAGLLPLIGIASVSEIAATLRLPLEEFARLWVQLPLADEEIARRLSLTRQQVINQRKAARRRLLRRIRNNFAQKSCPGQQEKRVRLIPFPSH